MSDKDDKGPGQHLFEYDQTSPLKRAKDPEEWQWRRMDKLREVIKGPSTPEDWTKANEEHSALRRGDSHDDEAYDY